MKKVLVFACALVITATSFANEIKVSEKARKAFETTFMNAENVVWSDVSNVYTVTFTQQGISTFVQYDEQGEFLGSRRYYSAEKLPIGIQAKIKKSFSDKTVFGVTEYTVADKVYYFIKLEGATSWTSIKVSNDGQIETLETFVKA